MKLFTKEELEQMRQMKNQGATYKEIGEMFGRSEATVQNKFSRLGWSTQPQAAQMTPPPRPGSGENAGRLYAQRDYQAPLQSRLPYRE